MKKNKMMRLASGLLVAVLLTTSAISGTFAKYVTSGEGTDSARVAKFGVTVSATGETFAKAYKKADENTGTDEFKAEAITVLSTDVDSDGQPDDDVVAPGTKGNLASFSITGTPEVDVRVEYVATTFDLGEKWVDKDGKYYCPIEITIGDDTYKGTTYDSADAFEQAVKDAIVAFKADYEAGTDLSTINNAAPKISWAWAFEENDDVKDTYLGDQAADNNAATIAITITCTVTQID